MEDLAVFTALIHSGSFRKNFVKFKKNKHVIYRLGAFFTICVITERGLYLATLHFVWE